MKSQRFAFGLIHEINNPLSVISARTELLLLKTKKNSSQEESLKAIQEQIERIEDITKKISYCFKLPKLNKTVVNISILITSSLNLLKKDAQYNKIAFKKSLHAGIDNIRCDEKLMKFAFFNLAQNALQSMAPGGTLKITARKQKGLLKVTFEDTGRGISKIYLKKIFEPFFSIKEKALGLGLTVAKNIIEEHKGKISVKSAQGKGSVFTVLIPIT